MRGQAELAPGSRENATACTPRAALRRTSAAASSTSHSGTMHSGIRRPPRVAAPLLDHPVVVRARRTPPRGPCPSPPANVWPQKRGNVGKHSDASTWFDVHVVEARLRVVAARAHLVVGDRRQRHVVAVEPDRGDVALVRRDEIFVEPACRTWAGCRPTRSRRWCRPCTSSCRCPCARRGASAGRRPTSSAASAGTGAGGSTTWSSTLTKRGMSRAMSRPPGSARVSR